MIEARGARRDANSVGGVWFTKWSGKVGFYFELRTSNIEHRIGG
jgi:hypothetical protein